MTPSQQTTPMTPVSPDKQFYDIRGVPVDKPLPGVGPQPSPAERDRQIPGGNKYSGDVDMRDGYRDGNRGDRRPGSGQERDRSRDRDHERGRDWDREQDRSRERSLSGRRDNNNPNQRPISGRHPDGRPSSAKDHPARKRDYFEKSEIDSRPTRRDHDRDRDHYDSDGYRTPHSYDDDSYNGIEDNNALMPKKIRDDIPDSDLIDYEDDGGESLVDSVPDIEFDENCVRIFIALFDYDPVTMSPNPDAMDVELPFKEGQLLKVVLSLRLKNNDQIIL